MSGRGHCIVGIHYKTFDASSQTVHTPRPKICQTRLHPTTVNQQRVKKHENRVYRKRERVKKREESSVK
jgi:hypothetical protein